MSSFFSSRWVRDLLAILVVVLAYLLIATRLNLSEELIRLALQFEHWQLDEMPITAVIFAFGLAWFGYRRMQELKRTLADKIFAEHHIAELSRHNSALTQRLLTVQEEERRTIARELHDEFGQNCTAIRVEARYIQTRTVSSDAQTHGSAQRIAQSAEHLYAHVKNLLTSLRPQTLDSLGPEAALQELCETWEEQTDTACHFSAQTDTGETLAEQPWSDAISMTLYRLVQEALTNVARHAEASEVRVAIRCAVAPAAQLVLTVQDNGRGLPPAMRNATSATPAGFGLLGMRERVAALQGNFQLIAPEQGGLRVQATLPLEQP